MYLSGRVNRARNFLKQNETLVILCAGELLFMMGLGFIAPIMPPYLEESFGVPASESGTKVGLLITIYAAARAVMDLPAGQFAQRFGRRPLLIIGPLLVSFSALACGLAIEYWQLMIFRFLQGLGSALFSVAAIIIIGEISTQANRGRDMSLYWGSLLVGSSLGPTLGGFLGEYLGDRVVFFCFSGLAFLATLWLFLRIPETKGMVQQSGKVASNPGVTLGTSSAGLRSLLRNADFVLVSVVALATLFTLAGSQLTIVPLLGYECFELTRGQVGLALTLVAIMQLILVLIAGRLSDRYGRKIIIVPGGIIAVLGLVMFPLSNSYLLYLLSAVVLGIGRGFSGPVPTAYAADIAPPGNYENTMALYRLASDSGFVLGPIVLGSFKDAWGLDFPLFFSAALLFMAIALFGLLAKETIHRPSS
jgi:MFS family permease